MKPNKIRSLLAGLFMFLTPLSAAASENKVEVSPEVSYYYYSEPYFYSEHKLGSGSSTYSRSKKFSLKGIEKPFISNQGMSYGIKVNNEVNFDRFSFRLENKFSHGKMNYDSIGNGTSEGQINDLYDGRVILGWLNQSGRKFYAGLGYRFLQSDLRGEETTKGFSGYLRKANYFYIPVGLIFSRREFSWEDEIQFKIEYDQLIFGKNYAAYTTQGNLAFDQYFGGGFRAGIKFFHKVNDLDLFVGADFNSWVIGESTRDKGNVEPFNYTLEPSISLGVKF